MEKYSKPDKRAESNETKADEEITVKQSEINAKFAKEEKKSDNHENNEVSEDKQEKKESEDNDKLEDKNETQSFEKQSKGRMVLFFTVLYFYIMNIIFYPEYLVSLQ